MGLLAMYRQVFHSLSYSITYSSPFSFFYFLYVILFSVLVLRVVLRFRGIGGMSGQCFVSKMVLLSCVLRL